MPIVAKSKEDWNLDLDIVNVGKCCMMPTFEIVSFEGYLLNLMYAKARWDFI